MPTILSHAVAALGIGAACFGRKAPARVWTLGALCAVLPDADVAGFAVGIKYGDLLGHRGLTHSFIFAAFLATLAVPLARSESGPGWRARLWTFFFLAAASHGLLDALTDGGLGVAFFAPFENARYFFPFRPIEVSPIGPGIFSERGLAVIRSELVWIWLPSLALMGTAWTIPGALSKQD
jgi:inner membrane protein